LLSVAQAADLDRKHGAVLGLGVLLATCVHKQFDEGQVPLALQRSALETVHCRGVHFRVIV